MLILTASKWKKGFLRWEKTISKELLPSFINRWVQRVNVQEEFICFLLRNQSSRNISSGQSLYKNPGTGEKSTLTWSFLMYSWTSGFLETNGPFCILFSLGKRVRKSDGNVQNTEESRDHSRGVNSLFLSLMTVWPGFESGKIIVCQRKYMWPILSFLSFCQASIISMTVSEAAMLGVN